MKHTKWEIMEMFNDKDIACGAVLSTADLINNAHLRERHMIVNVKHAQRGTFINVGCPIKMSASPVEVIQPPLLGEHSEEVLSELLGYSTEQIAGLRERGVI